MIESIHEFLPSGLELGVTNLPQRHVVSFQIRILVGATNDPGDRLGLARLVEETLDKGTVQSSGRDISAAFDAIGAGRGSGTGRETTTFSCTVLPEHFERAVALHAEFLRTPTFPEESVRVNVELACQELSALEDDAQALSDRLMSPRAYGPVLGRHPLGDRSSLEQVSRNDLEAFWRRMYAGGRMIVSVAGPVESTRAKNVFAEHFDGFGGSARQGRDACPTQFDAFHAHHHKDLEQQQISICFPGVDAVHEDFPIQQAALGILSGGMSARLFTEVREKRGLVYWVSAWQETPRGLGMIYLGASTTPERCELTFDTLLREVDRLSEDLEEEELERAVTGIVASQETRGDSTRARCGELAADLFFFGRPIPPEEKAAKLLAVTTDDVRRYLAEHPRDRLGVLTIGPKAMAREHHVKGMAGVTEPRETVLDENRQG